MKLIDLNDEIKSINFKDWYLDLDNDSDVLLICAGDSWTWGDHIDPSLRKEKIYGRVVSDKIKCDFINAGLCGGDNINIVNSVRYILKSLKKNYDQIYVIFTLTEVGRELQTGFFNSQQTYQVLKGDAWPEFDDIINNTESHDQLQYALDELQDIAPVFRQHLDLYLKIRNTKSINDLVFQIDQFVMGEIQRLKKDSMDKKIFWAVGKNYINWIDHRLCDGLTKLDLIWTEVISRQGNLASYPKNVFGFVTQIAMKPLVEYYKIHKQDYKKELIEVIENNLSALDWFDHSPYNNPDKNSARHPTALAHEWWADYLFNNLQRNEFFQTQ